MKKKSTEDDDLRKAAVQKYNLEQAKKRLRTLKQRLNNDQHVDLYQKYFEKYKTTYGEEAAEALFKE